MSLTWFWRYFAFIIYAVSASPLTTAENPSITTSLASNVSHLTSSSPIFILRNTTTSNALNVKCDGAQYGVNLDVADCKDAKAYISSGSVQRPWAERGSHLQFPHFFLPYRYMGGTCRNTWSLRVASC